MTIRNLVNACNSHADIEVDVFDCYHERLLYHGRYDEMPARLLSWEVESFRVSPLKFRVNGGGLDAVAHMTILVEYGAETR